MMLEDFAKEIPRARRIQAARHSSLLAELRLARLKEAARFARPVPARGGFPYFSARPRAKVCRCPECRKLDLMPLQGIPGARQLALPL